MLATLMFTLSGCIYVYEVPARRVDPQDRLAPVTYRTAPSGSVGSSLGALLNAERRARGLPAMSYNRTLSRAAQSHANDMSRRGYFSHTGADGTRPSQRVRRVGYSSCITSENLAQGQKNPQETMRDWMASPGHRSNNLHRGLREFGVGYAENGRYWVMLFASPGC